MRSIAAVFAALLVAGASSSARVATKPQITGLYSDMAFTSSGDLGGIQLFVTKAESPDSFYVQFQMAEGTRDAPMLMALQVQDSTISFAFPPGSKYSDGLKKFSGIVTRTGIRGKFANGLSVTLPRLQCSRS